jgi:GAF domain-containing protein/pyridoxamine 5'-phosphate oxidase-like protein
MTGPGLDTLTSCFQGIVPASLFTASTDGVPNVTFLSHVEYVDTAHVALSFQFFNKSRRNILENPSASVIVNDPDTGQGWRLRVRYQHSETSGPLYERMSLRIEAIASYSGLKGIFRLMAADVYEVLGIEPVVEMEASPTLRSRTGPTADPLFTMRALQDMAARLHSAESLEQLLDSILAGLEDVFGFRHAIVALTTDEPRVLATVASRGYLESGAGAEVRFGEGIIGLVAEAQKPIRISGLLRGLLYAYAVRRRAQQQGPHEFASEIPLPGLPSAESQLGIPLLVRGDLIGVLCIESETPYRFHEDDKTSIEVLGSYLAIAIQNMQLLERSDPGTAAPPTRNGLKASEPVQSHPWPARSAREIVYYATDECVLVDGEYLIRSLPARILWKLLSTLVKEGRAEFTNRELRLDKSLNLPEWKDNLETRLLLLRRRLEQKCPDIRLVPRGRGRFALELAGRVTLTERA